MGQSTDSPDSFCTTHHDHGHGELPKASPHTRAIYHLDVIKAGDKMFDAFVVARGHRIASKYLPAHLPLFDCAASTSVRGRRVPTCVIRRTVPKHLTFSFANAPPPEGLTIMHFAAVAIVANGLFLPPPLPSYLDALLPLCDAAAASVSPIKHA